MPNADQQYWDAHRTGERDDEQWPPLPTPESIYRGKCQDGDRCLHGCHRSEACHYVANSPGEREYASWRPAGVTACVPAVDADGEPITPQRLIDWLDVKFARHGEEEDKWAADYIRATLSVPVLAPAVPATPGGGLSTDGVKACPKCGGSGWKPNRDANGETIWTPLMNDALPCECGALARKIAAQKAASGVGVVPVAAPMYRKCPYCTRDMLAGSECQSEAQAEKCDMRANGVKEDQRG